MASEPYVWIVDDDAGMGIRKSDFATALHVWVGMQMRVCTVAEAALAFNTTPAIVRTAAEDCYWLALNFADPDPVKQTMEMDGE